MASLACALRRMPIRFDAPEHLVKLSESASVVVGLACQDRASSNIAFSKHVHQMVTEQPANLMFHSEWCELHNTNNLKIAAQDMVKLASRLYSMSALMNVSSYAADAVRRISRWVERHLDRQVGLRPDARVLERNMNIVDKLFDFNAPHHYRRRKDGTLAKSSLIIGLEELLAIDTGDWGKEELVCHCWDPETHRPKHRNIEECRIVFTMTYYKVYLGSSWPLPSVTKFTHMSIVMRRVMLGLSHHRILMTLIEPCECDMTDETINIFSLGSGQSDFQVVHRGRKFVVWQWMATPLRSWQICILAELGQVLDNLTYDWFGACKDPAPAHDVIKDGGLIGKAQHILLELLDQWSNDDSELWALLDSVLAPCRRSEAPKEVVRFLRRNVFRYAAGMLRRYELPFTFTEKPLHAALCDKCSPTQELREETWAKLAASRPCCRPAFANKLVALRSQHRETEAHVALCMRERLKLYSTKASESAHAHSHRVLGRGGNKPNSLASFARKVFMNKLLSTHVQHGGNPQWRTLSDKALLRSDRQWGRHQSAADASATLLTLREDGENVGHEGAIVPAMGEVANEPEEDLVAGSGYLNPVMFHFNQKQRAAKHLGLKVDHEFRQRALREVQAAYADPELQPKMFQEYQTYLFEHRANGIKQDIPSSEPLESTFWGWGTQSLPLPVQHLRAHVQDNGLVTQRQVKDPTTNDDFRVTTHEAAAFIPYEVTRPFVACGSSPFNECRTKRCTSL